MVAVEVRTRLAFNLAPEDLAKAERFTETRRAARLDEALTQDHIKFMREVEVAKTLANLRQPAPPGQPGANGSAPAAG